MMNSTFDLWKLLNEYHIVIPVIQRDYAQGRKDKKYIRKMFLSEIKDALCNNKPVSLDFVYGNINGNRFSPLDGQQRLTTLWLIYWYISFRADNLEEDSEILKKFTYETRPSSGEFCAVLCNEMKDKTNEDIKKYNGIVDFIKAQTWFYSEWLQDPTISAMFRTLGGDGSEAEDNIESCFDDCDYGLLRKGLIEKPVISFELMVIGDEKLPISDDLYIKMNARGKALTNFENFKADIVAWIQDDNNPDSMDFKRTINSISYRQYFPSQIDNKWTDVFWNAERKRQGNNFNGEIDEIYFSFINRFVVNEICLNDSMSPAEYEQNKGEIGHKAEKAAFDKLFGTGLRGSSADDSLINYEGIEVYKKYLNFQAFQDMDYIFEKLSDPLVMDKVNSALEIKDADENQGNRNEDKYSILPRYDKTHTLLQTRQKERVYFLAVCCFLLNSRIDNEFDGVKFDRWMRVVRNLTENAVIESVAAMVTCMRLIKRLSDNMIRYNNDIYKCLEKYDKLSANSKLEEQLNEEKEKAEKILSDNQWEEKIREAENFSFFNGTIRFLYRNVKTVNWNNFDVKFDTARKLFENPIPASTNEKLLRQFTGFDNIIDKYLFTSIGYHPRYKCWKKDILCSDNTVLLSKVHSLLMEETEPAHDNDYQDFLDSGIIEKIVGKYESYRYRYHWYSYYSIHKDYSQTEAVYVSSERKRKNEEFKKLSDAGKIIITDGNFNFYQNGYYWGVKVEFEYDGEEYRWYESYDNKRKDKIYRVENNKELPNAFVWEDSSDLIEGIEKFTGWN